MPAPFILDAAATTAPSNDRFATASLGNPMTGSGASGRTQREQPMARRDGQHHLGKRLVAMRFFGCVYDRLWPGDAELDLT